jgi:predicted transcriptional regulator
VPRARIPITEAESEIMAALWRRGPLTPRGLIDEVKLAQPWGDATIKTLLGRLMRKGAIRSERGDGRLTYRPLLDRATYVDGEVQALLDRLFDGRPEALAALLASRGEPD